VRRIRLDVRRLLKSEKPEVLAENEDDWTRYYISAASPAERKKHERWGHAHIRAALTEETDGKCAYCEASIGHVSYPHVEHMIPKSRRPDLAHRWHNLTSACEACNKAKSDYFDENIPIFNPYVDDVEGRLRFWGDYVDWATGDSQSEITIKRLRLNRQSLVKARVKRLVAIREVVERWSLADGALRAVLEDSIRLDAEQGEYTQTVSAYLQFVGFPLESAEAGDA
jgi:uncharacterized protein (TIGR02646 family)